MTFYLNVFTKNPPDFHSIFSNGSRRAGLGQWIHMFCCLERDVIHYELINWPSVAISAKPVPKRPLLSVVLEKPVSDTEKLRSRLWPQRTQSRYSSEGPGACTLDSISANTFPREEPCRTHNWAWIKCVL
jgi:hypothetical protein